jgi:hypothetical protein
MGIPFLFGWEKDGMRQSPIKTEHSVVGPRIMNFPVITKILILIERGTKKYIKTAVQDQGSGGH